MAQNPVYIGWAAWAAGPFWGTNSACCSDSGKWGSLEPGSLAADGSPGMYTTVWLNEIQPLLPNTLQKTGISSINGPAGPGVPPGGGSSSSSSSKPSSTSTSSSSSSRTSSSSIVPGCTPITVTTTTTVTVTIGSPTTIKPSSTSFTTSAKPSSTPAPKYGQCGGIGWAGPTTCAAGSTCTYSNPYFSQCL